MSLATEAVVARESAAVATPAAFPPPKRRPGGERTITVSLSIAWPSSAPPTRDDLPALTTFLRAVKAMATAGVATGVPDLERVIQELRIEDEDQGAGPVPYRVLVERAQEQAFRLAFKTTGGHAGRAAVLLGLAERTGYKLAHRIGLPIKSYNRRAPLRDANPHVAGAAGQRVLAGAVAASSGIGR